MQHLYPVTLTCNTEEINLKENKLNVDAAEIQPRQNAAAIANFRIKNQAEDKTHEE